MSNINALEIKKMGKVTADGKKPVGRPRGRPLGSGHGTQLVHVLRRSFEDAIDTLEARGRTLPELLADAMERDVNTTVKTLAALLPKDVEVKVSAGDTLADSLSGVQAALARQKSERAQVIDAEVVETDAD